MARKYFIGSHISFLSGIGQMISNGGCATHYKQKDAQKIIANKEHLGIYKVRKSTKGNDYVIGQKIKCIGNDNNIVDNIEAARKFDTRDSAIEYAKTCSSIVDQLNVPCVYDTDFQKKQIITQLITKKSIEELNRLNPICMENAKESISSTPRIYLTPTQRAKIYNKSNKRCAICGKPLSIDDFTVDHIIPLSLGGTYDEDNLQATHEKCNFMKGNMDPAEFNNLTQSITEYQMINNFDYNRMLSMSRIMVRGTIKSFGGF